MGTWQGLAPPWHWRLYPRWVLCRCVRSRWSSISSPPGSRCRCHTAPGRAPGSPAAPRGTHRALLQDSVPEHHAQPCPQWDHGLGAHPAPPSCPPSQPGASPALCCPVGLLLGGTEGRGRTRAEVPLGYAVALGRSRAPPARNQGAAGPAGGCTGVHGAFTPSRGSGGVPVCGEVQARPQPEKQHLWSPGQSLSSAQWLGHAAVPRRAGFRGQRPGLAAGGQRLREPAAAPAPLCPRTAMGGCGPMGLPHGISSPGSGRDGSGGHHPSPCPAGCPRCPRGPRGRCLTWLCGQAACAAAVGAALLRRAAGGVVAAARPAARPAGAGTGAVAWALCGGRRSVHGVPGSGGPLGTPPAPAAGSPPHPIPCVWPYLWRGGGRRGRPRGGSTSRPRGSCGRRGSTACWGAGGCSPLPGTRLLCPGLAGWLAAGGPAGHGVAGGRQWGQRHGPLLGAAGLGRGEAPRTGPGAPAPGCQRLASCCWGELCRCAPPAGI